MKNCTINRLLIITLLSLTLNSCSIFGGRTDVKDLTKTFFVGEEGTQYYIKPLAFETEEGDELLMDVTFRYKDEIKDSAVINFTIVLEQLVKSLGIVTISNSTTTYVVDEYELLFAEKDGDDFKSRFSIKIPMFEFDKLMKNPNWIFTLDQDDSRYRYFTTSSTAENLNILNDDLFVIFR